MPWQIIATFVIALLPIILTPGTSAVLVTQHVSTGGRRLGATVMAGTATGLYLHAVFATVGLSALVMASATAFAVVKYVGAAYLVGLGVYIIATSARDNGHANHNRSRPSVRQVYVQALAGNLVNPRAALVYLTLPAQVVGPDVSVAYAAFLLATIHTIMMTSWLSMWTQLLATAKRSGLFTFFTRHVPRVGGVLLIALGFRAAVSH